MVTRPIVATFDSDPAAPESAIAAGGDVNAVCSSIGCFTLNGGTPEVYGRNPPMETNSVNTIEWIILILVALSLLIQIFALSRTRL